MSTHAGGGTVTATGSDLYLWGDVTAGIVGADDSAYLDTRDDLSVSGTGQQVTLGATGNVVTLAGSADITAQSGDHAFVSTLTAGATTITRFDATDTLQFSSSQVSDWQSLLGHASQHGADTVIQADASHSLTLAGVTLAELDRNHVQFA